MLKFLSLFLLVACSTAVKKPELPPGSTVVVTPAPQAPSSTAGHWQPKQGAKFQILDEKDGNFAQQVKNGTDFVNIELFDASSEQIEQLHGKGVKVVCYYNLAYQPGNPDIDGKSFHGWHNPVKFPKEALGPKMSGYNEKWTDVRNEQLHLFNDERDKLAKQMKCDGVEGGDNMDNNSGEAIDGITKADLVKSNKRRADHAHSLGLAHFAKNTPEIAKEASLVSDGVFIEQALLNNEMDDYSPWWKNGKGAYAVEYPKGLFGSEMNFSKCQKKAKEYASKVKVDYHEDGDYFNGESQFCN